MKYKVKCLYKDGIVMLPKSLWCEPNFIGNLLLFVEDDVEHGSSTFKARLVDMEKLDLLPPLSDIELVPGDDGEMLVRGHYYKVKLGLPYKQSWFIRLTAEP